MKKIAVLFVLLFLCSFASAQDHKGVNFESLTLDQAIAKIKSNKKGPKYVFMDCYTEWCGPCKYMSDNIFPQQATGDFFNPSFVSIKVDMEKGEGPELGKKYKINAYPTFLIFNNNGEEVGRVVGGGDLETFLARVNVFIDPSKSPEALKAVFEREKTFANAAAYMDALSYTGKRNEAIKFINDNFDQFADMDKFSEKYWKYIEMGMSAENSKVMDYIVENRGVYNSQIGKNKVDKVLIGIYQNRIMSYLSGAKTLTREQAAALITCLSLLEDENEVARYHVMLGSMYMNGQMDRIIGLFNVQAFSYASTDAEKYQIERIFMSIKGMPQEKIREYYENKAKMYRSNADSFEKTAHRYQ